MDMFDRRAVVAGIGAAALMSWLGPAAALAQAPRDFVMWHGPGCGCCLVWLGRVRAAFGRPLQVIESADLLAVKRGRGVPDDLWSCHTALVAGYVIEGHVPPADIQRLARSRDRAVRGLAVAGMPLGSPGMEVPGGRTEPYEVIAFGPSGRRVFARHG